MNIIHVAEGAKPAYSIQGNTINIAGQTFDLSALQSDVQKVIGVRSADGKIHLATIIIPPRTMVETPAPENDYGVEFVLQPAELDFDSVTLQLFPLEES